MSTSTPKRILVTGGNKGIGKAICERLLSEYPDTHVILGARDQARGEAAVADLTSRLDTVNCRDRLELLVLDTSSDGSVQAAAASMKQNDNDDDDDKKNKNGSSKKLYGIINNAGIGWGSSMKDTVNTNYFGPRRVNEAFGQCLERPGGRIVNVASASGPNYVSGLNSDSPNQSLLAKPWTIPGGIAQVDQMARDMKEGDEAYGASKALLNAYTILHAKIDTDLIINSVTPGFIKTDLTAGTTASNPTEKGAIPPCYLMMDEDVANKPSGRYYGSDCVRSPISFYRGPGDPPYEDDEDLVELPASASQMATIL